ncbi:ROK family transcriptional regulator [Glycomyces paridis]|uniref:ROK family transcriptional regulator n=1 Tax=Glycomyces paridis TaxID=2126555 RepID=A0A4S8PGD6_9ACTN|nr:ROK family transcriptional regulator [Glycomyces paridis]THV29593.1 ROK family transcriptional regulator [Glycomyces paridis]
MRAFGSDTRLPTVAMVLDLLRERDRVSRIELAQATGLTRATMTNAVRKLIDLGFVQEAGTARSHRGTPRRLLELRSDACRMVGVQFDRYSAVAVVVDLAGRIVARGAMPAPGDRGPDAVLPEFAANVRDLLESAGLAPADVLGIGLATYGPQDREAGALLTPQPTAAWQGYPLAAGLSELTGLPVAIENDATAAGIGMQALGGSPSNFALVFMGGGIGAGLIIDGLPYRGATANGLELGHISVDMDGPRCDCGNRGCVDAVAGAVAIAARAHRDPDLVSRLGLGGDPLADFRTVAAAAASGDAAASALIAVSARALAVATVSLVNLLDVGRIVLAGNAFADIGPVYRRVLQEEVDRAVFMRHVHEVRVELAEDVSCVAAVGAAMVVLRNLLESPEIGDRPAPKR